VQSSREKPRRRLVVGMSGSSAPQLGVALLEHLKSRDDVEVHLVMSRGARLNLQLEADTDPDSVAELADVSYGPDDLAAAISSGSFLTDGMVVIPCSMRTLAAVATGNSTDLLIRACDVTLKERRKLVLVTRETPLNLIHIRNMETVTLAGATILPPVLSLYHRPQTIHDIISQIVGKVLDQFSLSHDVFRRWGEEQE
jgi:polyprenyl P-hydroxybenzoate/phenylacrylic acid decarboxylase-like protein